MTRRATTSARRGPGLRAAVLAFLLVWRPASATADELADFHAAVEQATADYRDLLETMETGGQPETKAAVGRFRQAWQQVGERFAVHRPPALANDTELGATFMQVDARLVGVLLVIDMGNRDAARAALAPIAETLTKLSARTTPVPP